MAHFAHGILAAPLRSRPVDEIDTAAVLAVLTPLWQEKPETASRVRGRIEAVLDAAKAQGHRSGENPAAWRGHLAHLLPKRGKLTRGHHAAMAYRDVPAFVAKLRECDAIAAMALEFCILTATRSGEVYGARWSEIDMAAKVWTVPAERMKAAREHRVPLSDRALAILERLSEARTGDLVFPSPRGRGRCLTWRWRRSCADWKSMTRRFMVSARLPRLGGQRDAFRARGRRGGACACYRRQGRASLSARRRARKATGAYGRMGGVVRAEG